MAKCVCGKRTRTRVISGQKVIVLCADCAAEMDAAKKLTESCPHPATRKTADGTDMQTCVGCGALKCDDGTWEAPARRPRIRRVV